MTETTLPKLENKICELLDGKIKETALKFIDYLSMNQLTVEPAGEGNNYKIPFNGKNLCKIWINSNKIEFHFWFGDYSGEFDKDFTTAVQERVCFCWTCHDGCTGSFDVPVFGKELKNVCSQHTIVFENPDDKTLEYVKRMMEYSKKIVMDSVSYHANH